MNYIIFDLEWSNFYNYATKTGMNEVVEIGALKLNTSLEIIDSFKQLVKPTFAKKLSGRCKNLTKITNEEIKKYGITFEQAIMDFARWCGEDNLFLSWSNSDLYVLANNYQKVLNNCNIKFMKNYCDAQKYCMQYIPSDLKNGNNQVGLSNCAEIFGINVDTDKLHRALADCYITAECLKKVYNKTDIVKFIQHCDTSFFERLLYKAYMITEPRNELFNIDKVELLCPKCKSQLVISDDINCKDKAFIFPANCQNCKKSYWCTVRAKKTYDGVVVSKHIVAMNKRKAKKMNG